MIRLLIITCILLVSLPTSSQEYNYTHYSIRDGLPSNMVYDVKQDRDGFIWFATDAGAVRYDGKEFLTFTMQDGLPSMDVMMVYPDSKGRIWMSFVKNELCYYYQGKIYNKHNDTLVSKLQFNIGVNDFAEDKQGNLLLASIQRLPVKQPSIFIINSSNEYFPIKASPGHFFVATSVAPHSSGFLLHQRNNSDHGDTTYLYDQGILSKWRSSTWNPDKKQLKIFEYVNGNPRMLDSFYLFDQNLPGLINDSDSPAITNLIQFNTRTTTQNKRRITFFNTNSGAYYYDTVNYRQIDHFLPEKRISRAFIDNENNFWFPTLGEGVFKLASREFRTYRFSDKHNSITSIGKSGDAIYAGGNFSNLYMIRNKQVKTINFGKLMAIARNNDNSNRLIHILPVEKNKLILSFDGFLLEYDPKADRYKFCNAAVVKSSYLLNKDTLLVSTGRGCFRVDRHNLKILDTFLNSRTYATLATTNGIYFGTANGLYKYRKNGSLWFMGDAIPTLQNQVNHLVATSDSSIWITTYGGGLVQLKNDQVVNHFTVSNGLSSNTCKSIYADGRFVWVGTERGLSRIDQLNPQNLILRYSVSDGLASNDILSLFVDGSEVYAGTSNGLTVFDTARLLPNSFCRLNLLSAEVGKQIRPIDSFQSVSYKENDFKFTFIAISLRSDNNILYHYRLKGLKEGWDSTSNNFLEFLSLQPGNYELEIFATNKLHVNSNTLSIPFSIKPPFWATWWFRLLVTGFIISLAWALILRRIRKEKAKAATQNKINELEQLALRSQMNPHFIFNCLNSIQNFLLQSDFEKTNEYLTSFAHLIRQTLDNSSKPLISIEDEAKYLYNYLELESMRFRQIFEYSIEIDPAMDAGNTYIPTMLLQPYVENSIRHGLRYRTEGTKTVRIIFEKTGNTLVCKVEDNGVGRKKSAALKSFVHVEYQSKGMTMTAERIAALNRRKNPPITVEIVDMETDGNATGTQVVLRFPNTFL